MASFPVGLFVAVNTKNYGVVNGVILEDRGSDYRVLTPDTGAGYTAADARDLVIVAPPIGPHDRLAIAMQVIAWLTQSAESLSDLCGGEAPTEEDEHEWDKICQVMEACAGLRKGLQHE